MALQLCAALPRTHAKPRQAVLATVVYKIAVKLFGTLMGQSYFFALDLWEPESKT